MNRRIKFLGYLVLVVSTFIITACGGGKTGVILWSPDTEILQNNQLVKVEYAGDEELIIQATIDGKRQNISVESWRIFNAPSASAAKKYQNEYRDFAAVTAISQRNALPMREETNASSDIIYRLREGEIAKVLDRSGSTEEIGNMNEYWYYLLAEDGSRGYTYGYYLAIQNIQEDTTESSSSSDEQLQTILDTPWKPQAFQEMIENNRINTRYFDERYGLFFHKSTQQVEIYLPDFHRTFDYENIEKTSWNSYFLPGAEITIRLRESDNLLVQFPANNKMRTEIFAHIEVDFADLLQQEIEKQQQQLQQITTNGTQLHSTAYGSISIQSDGRFRWSNYGMLQDRIIPAGAGNTGQILLDYHLSRNLQSRYSGVLAFQFDQEPDNVVFLYEQTADGIRLTYAPDNTIDQFIVQNVSTSPTILFFRYQ